MGVLFQAEAETKASVGWLHLWEEETPSGRGRRSIRKHQILWPLQAKAEASTSEPSPLWQLLLCKQQQQQHLFSPPEQQLFPPPEQQAGAEQQQPLQHQPFDLQRRVGKDSRGLSER